MDIVKKNLLSIICAVVAIAAVVATFVPLGGMVQSVQEVLNKDKQTHDQMQAQLTKERTFPVTDPDKAEPDKLDRFPSQKVLDSGKVIVENMKAQSLAMRDVAVEMNKHALLVPNSLPIPPSQYQQYQFRDQYRGLLIPGKPGELPKLVASMKAGIPPTAEELTRKKQEILEQVTKDKLIVVGNQPEPRSLQQVQLEVAERHMKLPDEMRLGVAQKSLVYVMPDAFELYPNIVGSTAPDPGHIFFAQVCLWIQQDLIAAVNDTNKGSKNVIEAPVKRLVKMQIPPMFVRAPEVATSGDPDAAVAKSPTISASGRVSNPLYDVFQFSVSIDIEAAQVNRFLHELSRNRLINVNNLNISTIDSAQLLGQGFVYGDAPIVNVQLECEALFMRQWMIAIIPPIIKQQLQITDQPATPGAEAPPAPTASANR